MQLPMMSNCLLVLPPISENVAGPESSLLMGDLRRGSLVVQLGQVGVERRPSSLPIHAQARPADAADVVFGAPVDGEHGVVLQPQAHRVAELNEPDLLLAADIL